jgi:hypothetical protein
VKTNNKQSNAFALSAAIEKIGAFRVHDSVSTSHKWAYFADETESYWLVTSASLILLADMEYDAWAEKDENAHEYGKKPPRRETP